MNLVSAYHMHFREQHGWETHPTAHMYKQEKRRLHIDYCFIPRPWTQRLRSVQVGSLADWRKYSDHCPLTVGVRV